MVNIKIIFILKIFFITNVISLPTPPANPINVKCFFIDIKTFSVFDLNRLNNIVGRNFDTIDSYKVNYNFCNDLIGTNSQMYAIKPSYTPIYLSGSSNNSNNWTLLNQSDVNGGLNITLNNGNQCQSDPTKNYSVRMELKCDKNTTEVNFTNTQEFSVQNCQNVLRGSSQYACPTLNFFAIAQFVNKYFYGIGAVMIVIGFVLCFFGSKFIEITIYLGSILIVLTASFIMVFDILFRNSNLEENMIWIIGGVAILAGLILGYLFNKAVKIFFSLLGAYLGYVIGILVYSLFLNKIQGVDPNILYWITIGVCALIFSIVSYIMFEYIVVFSTALIGSYLAVRGASLYIGGFPQEALVMQLIKNKEEKELENLLTGKVYYYLGGIVLLFIIGVIFQTRYNREQNNKTGNADKGAYYTRIET